MEWFAPDVVWPVLGAMAAGAAVGLEREFRGQPAGLRTHIIVALASCFLMLMATRQGAWAEALPHDALRIDPVRMAQGILTGVGFVCGGVIFRTNTSVHGLTTAASLWFCSALGMLFGVGLYALAIEATVLVLIVLSVLRIFDERVPQEALAQLVVRFSRDAAPTGPEFKAELRGLGIKNSTFIHRLTDRGATMEFATNVRAPRPRDMERLLDVLRNDARVVEFELSPHKT